MKRRQNGGLRKVCGCPRRTWAKCTHPWHFNFKARGGQGASASQDASSHGPAQCALRARARQRAACHARAICPRPRQSTLASHSPAPC